MTEAQQRRALKKQAVIDYMKLLPVKKYACANAGISDETLSNWLKEDKEFLERFKEAEAKFFHNKATKAKPEFLLERLDKETFGQKQEINVSLDFRDKVIQKYSATEGKIDEVPRPEEIENRPPESSS